MKLHFKYDIRTACTAILEEQLKFLGILFESINLGEVDLNDNISSEKTCNAQ